MEPEEERNERPGALYINTKATGGGRATSRFVCLAGFDAGGGRTHGSLGFDPPQSGMDGCVLGKEGKAPPQKDVRKVNIAESQPVSVTKRANLLTTIYAVMGHSLFLVTYHRLVPRNALLM